MNPSPLRLASVRTPHACPLAELARPLSVLSLLALALALVWPAPARAGDAFPPSTRSERVPLDREAQHLDLLPANRTPGAARRLAAPTPGHPVRLKSGTFAGAGSLAANARDAFATDPTARRQHVLIQFAQPPAPPARARLAAAGITLLDYVPENTYFASLDRDTDLAVLLTAGATWLGRLYPEDKLSPTLLAGQPGSWALEPHGQVRLRLRWFEDVPEAVAAAEVQQTGSLVLEAHAAVAQLEVLAPLDAVPRLAASDAFRWIEEVPPPMQTFNDGLRASLQIPELDAPPYALTGAGVTVGLWDGGWVDFTHPDFTGRAFPGEASGPVSKHPHATHVAGTLAGDGQASANRGGAPGQWRGVAPGAKIISYDVSNGQLVGEHRDARERFNAVISHNSWGVTVDSFFGNCHLLGDYTGEAPNYDRLTTGLHGAPYHVIFAIGNARGRRDSTGCPSPSGYRTVGVPATAKNVLSVGAINSDDHSMTVFSGWGPTDDGRLKPELVAPGDEVGGDGGITSTTPNGAYGTSVGTSMAAPAVSGAVALLTEDYRQLLHGQTPLPSTARGLLVHTAADLGEPIEGCRPGPDFASGYGRVQVRAAVDHFRAGGWLVGQVAHGEQVTYGLEVPPDTESVKVTLVWDDVPAVENAARTLVHDLDLIVTDPASTRHYPWTLDPANPSAPAVRTVEDRLNVIEQVYVDTSVQPGRWHLTVFGRQIASGLPQKFTLLYTPITRPPVPLLVLEQALPSDLAAGNGNGVLDQGEEIEETVLLRHTDGPAALGVTAQLATDSPYVRLLTDAVTYGDILPGTLAAPTTPLRYRLAKDVPCGQLLTFRHITTVGDHRFTNLLSRVVGRLEVTNVTRQVFAAADVPQLIPDNATLNARLPIETPGLVLGLQVAVRLDHPWLDDLRLTLRHPDGTAVILMPALVHFGQNLGQGLCGPDVVWARFDDAAALSLNAGTSPFAGSFRPHEPLAALLNRPLEGDWELLLTDVSAEDEGVLWCWQLEVEFAEQGYLCEFVNRPPATSDSSAVLYRNRPQVLTLPAQDPDEDPLAFHLLSPPAHGTLEDWDPLTGQVRYLPDPDYEGPDQFTFQVTDGYLGSGPATVTLEIRPATADLSVRQTLSPEAPRHGEEFTLTLTIDNHGPSPATGVLFTNVLPPGVHLLTAALTGGTLLTNAQEIVGLLDPLPEQGQAVLTWTGHTPAPGWYTNHATVWAREFEPRPEDNHSALPFHVWATADLSLAHDAASDPAPLGEPLALSLAVTNHGPFLASNVTIRSELAPGLRFLDATSTLGPWTHDQGVFTAHLGHLEVDQVATLEFLVIPEQPGPLANLATVFADQPDPDPANNSAQAQTTIRSVADLQLLWSPPSHPLAGGEDFTNHIRLVNLGPFEATAVVARIVLDEDLEWIRATLSQGETEPGPDHVQWSVGTLPAQGEASMILVTRARRLGVLTNTAAVAAFEFDPVPANNAVELLCEVRAEADLAAVVPQHPYPLVPGRPITYSLSVTNRGPSTATEVQLVYTLPPGWSLLSLNALPGSAAFAQGRVTATWASLPSGSQASLTLQALPPEPAETLHRFRVTGREVDLVPTNNTVEVRWLVQEPADLRLTKSVEPSQVLYSRPATYALVVTNRGPSSASGVRATDVLPEGLLVASTLASQGQAHAHEGSVAFDFGDLPVGHSATGWIQVLAFELGRLTNAAYVSAAQPDLVSTNDAAEVPLEVLPAVDLAITRWSVDPAPRLDIPVRLTLTLTNHGPQTATGVQLEYTLPEGAEFLAAEGAQDPVVQEGTFRCLLPDVPPETEASLALLLRPTLLGAFLTPATLQADQADLEPDNNTLDIPFTVQPDADLALACTFAPDPAFNGQPVHVTLTVTNQGPYPADQVEVEALLPDHAQLEDVALSQGEWSRPEAPVLAHLGPLEVHATATLTLTLRPGLAGPADVLAQVRSPQPDRDPANNECTASLTLLPSADLAVLKHVHPDPAALGQPMTYSVTVTNRGPDRATGVQLTEHLADSLGFFLVTPSQGSWRLEADVVHWNVETLDPQAAATLELVLIPQALGPVRNLAAVAAQEHDPRLDDNQVEHLTEILPPGDLALALEAPSSPILLGQTLAYRFTLTNPESEPATDVLLRHPLPPDFHRESLLPSEGTVTWEDGELRWSLDSLAAHATATLDLTLLPLATGHFHLPATVAAFAVDRTPADNQVEVAFVVLGQAELALTHSLQPSPLLLDQTAVLELALTQSGPQPATGLVLTQRLPAGLSLEHAELPQGTLSVQEDLLVIELGSLDPGETIVTRLHLRALELGTWTLDAWVDAEEVDLDPADNAVTLALEVLPAADLRLTKTLLDPLALQDQPARFLLTLTNDGPSPATEVRLTDFLPAATEFLAAEPDSGTYHLEGAELHYEPGTLPPGASATLILTLRPTLLGPLTNTASAFALEGDPDPANNTAQATADVILAADLALLASVPRDVALLHQPFEYTLTVTNAGPHPASAVQLRATLPQAPFLAASVSQGEWEQAENALLARFGDLAPGATATLQITVTPEAEEPLHLQALAEAAETDPQPDNNHAALLTPARLGADLSVAIWPEADDALVGQPFRYLVLVSNQGPATARDLTVTNQLPAASDLIAIEGAPDTWQTEPGHVAWHLGELPAGAQSHTTFTVVLRTAGPFTTAAEVHSPLFDPAPADNLTTFSGQAYPQADLLVFHEPVPPSLLLSNAFPLVVVVTNQGVVPAPRTEMLVAFSLNVEIRDAELSRGNHYVAEPGIVCNLGELAPGDHARLTITLRPTRVGLFVSQAGVLSPAADRLHPNSSSRVEREIVNTPTLIAEPAGNRLTLSWPLIAADFQLEYKDQLDDPAWLPVPNPPSIEGQFLVVSLKMSSPLRFFRLRQPESPGD